MLIQDVLLEFAKSIIPSIITAVVSIIALITSYKATKKSNRQAYNLNIENMKFTQKEKVTDQMVEKASILLTKCDPNVLNSVINEIVPRPLTHLENAQIRNNLLSIPDDIQTLSSILKLLSFSIEEEVTKSLIEDVYFKLDTVHNEVQSMILKLLDIYTAMTPEGNIKGINVMDEKKALERGFSESYPESYIQLHISLTSMVRIIREKSIPKPIQ